MLAFLDDRCPEREIVPVYFLYHLHQDGRSGEDDVFLSGLLDLERQELPVGLLGRLDLEAMDYYFRVKDTVELDLVAGEAV